MQEVLFEFKAGKMVANGTRVVPDPRKGLVRLVKVGYICCIMVILWGVCSIQKRILNSGTWSLFYCYLLIVLMLLLESLLNKNSWE